LAEIGADWHDVGNKGANWGYRPLIDPYHAQFRPISSTCPSERARRPTRPSGWRSSTTSPSVALGRANLEVYDNKLGCHFVEISPSKGSLLSWKEFEFRDPDGNVLQSMRCEYCHSLGQACYAVSGPDWHQLALADAL
jgi:hypothetical protein